MAEHTGKRKYKRLTVEQWAKAEAYWRSGSHTLEHLSGEFGVTTRALQAHFAKRGVSKGTDAAMIAAAASEGVVAVEVDDYQSRVQQARSARRRTVADAEKLRSLLMAQVSTTQTDPENAFRAVAAIKALSMAAATLERLQSVTVAALNVDTSQTDELPVIQFFDLSDEDIEQIREASASEADAYDEENEVVEEGI